MIALNKALWFDDCAADTAVLLGFAYLLFASLFVIGYMLRRRYPDKGYARGSCEALMITAALFAAGLTIIFLVRPFPPEIVRVSIGDAQLIEVRRCHGWTEDRLVYPLDTVAFRYERQPRGDIVDHLLVIGLRDQPEPIGSVKFWPAYNIDLAVLRRLAPTVVLEYERARTRALDPK